MTLSDRLSVACSTADSNLLRASQLLPFGVIRVAFSNYSEPPDEFREARGQTQNHRLRSGTTCWRHYAKQLLLLLLRRDIGKKKLRLSGNFPLHLKQ